MFQLAINTETGFKSAPGQHLTSSDFLYGFFIMVIVFSSPFIYSYYRDKKEKENRKRNKENQK